MGRSEQDGKVVWERKAGRGTKGWWAQMSRNECYRYVMREEIRGRPLIKRERAQFRLVGMETWRLATCILRPGPIIIHSEPQRPIASRDGPRATHTVSSRLRRLLIGWCLTLVPEATRHLPPAVRYSCSCTSMILPQHL